MKNVFLVTLLMSAGAGTAFAHHEAGGKPSGQAQAPAASQKTGKGTGLIQQIDREKGVVTIKHGPLQGIILPGTTMSFLVKEKTMLSNLQPQQQVDFELTHENGIYVITKIR